MGRIKCGVYRDSGFTKKRDTPVKAALGGRHKHRRFLRSKHYEALPEEPELEETTVKPSSTVLTSSKPVHLTAVFHGSSPAHRRSTRHTKSGNERKPGHQAPPAGHTSVRANHKPEAFKGREISAEEEPPIKEEEEQSLTVTPKSPMSSATESDTTLSFDNDEEDCYSSTSLSSSSLPSPETFRKEHYVKEELLGVSLQVKNSTLLDVSHAETIQMHHNPNISSIVDASTILAEKNCENSNYRGPEVEAQIKPEPFTSANQGQVFKRKSPAITTSKRHLSFKKKVSFKCPLVAVVPEAKHVPVIKLTVNNVVSDTVPTSSPAELMKPDKETSGAGELNSGDGTVHVRVALKRPVKRSLEKAKFFDFAGDGDRDLFFQRMRERCVKLRSIPLFPLSVPESMDTSVL
uniref:uncharacterized protein LOC122779971 isoform X2 n=1 Tax=Solea senegalensis TaxID=28829 RepID=UPI001CD87848|nr:uncharacterized protein LOC122779971 isoform X2 [Solea senegalensis]